MFHLFNGYELVYAAFRPTVPFFVREIGYEARKLYNYSARNNLIIATKLRIHILSSAIPFHVHATDLLQPAM
jgi:hypothetical protein